MASQPRAFLVYGNVMPLIQQPSRRHPSDSCADHSNLLTARPFHLVRSDSVLLRDFKVIRAVIKAGSLAPIKNPRRPVIQLRAYDVALAWDDAAMAQDAMA